MIQNHLDLMSADIRECELYCTNCHVEVSHGSLTWRRHQGKWRIMMGDRPLIEQPVVLRTQGYTELRPFFDALSKEVAQHAARVASVHVGLMDALMGTKVRT